MPINPARARVGLSDVEPRVDAPQRPAATSQPEIPPAAQRFFADGRRRFEDELWGEAINELSRALQLAPDYFEARLLLVRASLLQGNLALAQTHLEDALRQRPADAAVHVLLGDLAWRSRDARGTIQHLRRALLCADAAPDSAATIQAHLYLGLTLQSEGYLSAAASELTSFLSATGRLNAADVREPELRQAMQLYGDKAALEVASIHEALGQPERAVDALRAAAARRPAEPELRRRMAQALAAAGRGDEALQTAQKLVEADPKSENVDVFVNVIERVGTAARVEEELLRIGRQARDPILLDRLVDTLQRRDRVEPAMSLLHRRIELQPEAREPRRRLAAMLLTQADHSGYLAEIVELLRRDSAAFDYADRLLARAMSDARARAGLLEAVRKKASTGKSDAVWLVVKSRLELRDEQLDAAAASAEAACKADGTMAAAYVALAESRMGQRRWDAAKETCERALKAGLRNAVLYRVKGEIAESLGESDVAEQAYGEATKLDTADARAWLSLARVLDRQGKFRPALEAFEKASDVVEVGDYEIREALIRALLTLQKIPAARKQLAALRREDAPPVVVGRAEALFKLATDDSRTGQERLARYRDALVALAKQYPQDVDSAMDLALSHVATREYEAALKVLDALLARRERVTRALELRATMLGKLLRFDEAIAAMDALLRERPSHPAWLVQLAELAMDGGDYSAAARAWRKLAELPGSNDPARRVQPLLIESLRLSGDQAGALAAAKSWYEREPKDIRRRTTYLAQLNRAGKQAEALALARNWYDLKPTDAAARTTLVGQLQSTKHHAEAQAFALQWLAEKPNGDESMRRVVQTVWASRQWDAALELLRTMSDDPGTPDGMERFVAETYVLARRFDEAAKVLRKMLRSAADDADRADVLRMLIAARQYNEAEELAQQLLRPQLERMHANVPFNEALMVGLLGQLSVIYQNTGRQARADEMLEKALELTPNDPGVNNDVGYTWSDRGRNVDRAERMIRLALSEEPRNAAYLDSYGWVLYKKGDFAGAARYLRRSVLLSEPPDAVLHDHLGDTLYRLQDSAGAAEQWRRAVEVASDPDRLPRPEDEALFQRCRAKLAALEKKQPVETAPLAGESPTTAPASQRADKPAAAATRQNPADE